MSVPVWPVTGIDHILIAVRDLKQARTTWEGLGFRPTPMGRHTKLGSVNHCLMLENDYLELLAIDPQSDVPNRWAGLLEVRQGVGAVALRSTDSKGAAVALRCLAAQTRGGICGPLRPPGGRDALLSQLRAELGTRPRVIIIGALGRTGRGAADLCAALDLPVTGWDMAETAHGGPFPEILAHEVFLNCILAGPGCPVFVPSDAGGQARALRVIGDIACDPTSDFSPVRVYDRVTDWSAPALRVHDDPPLDVTAIDNLPSLLPREASEDYAAQLLPALRGLVAIDEGVWARARAAYERSL